MMKRKLIVVGALLIGTFSFAQSKFAFNYTMEEDVEVRNVSDVRSHYLGDQIAVKLQLLKESYTYIEKDEISLAERTVVEKPSIYYSVKKIDKYLKKELKKGGLTESEAIEILDNILIVTLNIRYQDTENLEALLWEIKDPKEIAQLYSDRVVLEM